MVHVVSLWLTVTSLLVAPAFGWPNAAGQCLVGESSVGPPHLPSGSGDISLSGNGIQVSVDGTAVVDASTPIAVTAGTEHTITISSTGMTPFKGYLIVLSDPSGTIGDLSTALVPQDAATGQLSTFCATPAIVGVTHTNNATKTSVSTTFVLDQDAQLAMDVTVVLVNTLSTGGVSEYGYAGYQLVNSADDGGGGSTTTAPSVSPGTATTTAPTIATVAPVTATPTVASVGSDTPSSAPNTAGGDSGAEPAPTSPASSPTAPTSGGEGTGGGGGGGASGMGTSSAMMALDSVHGCSRSALAAGIVALVVSLAL